MSVSQDIRDVGECWELLQDRKDNLWTPPRPKQKKKPAMRFQGVPAFPLCVKRHPLPQLAHVHGQTLLSSLFGDRGQRTSVSNLLAPNKRQQLPCHAAWNIDFGHQIILAMRLPAILIGSPVLIGIPPVPCCRRMPRTALAGSAQNNWWWV